MQTSQLLIERCAELRAWASRAGHPLGQKSGAKAGEDGSDGPDLLDGQLEPSRSRIGVRE